MTRTTFVVAALAFLSGCVVTAHRIRPAWAPAWSTVEEAAASAGVFNVTAPLYDGEGCPLPAGEVTAVPVSSEARSPWSLKTSDYLTVRGAELRLSPGAWRIQVNPPAGIRPVSRELVVQAGMSYRVNFYTVAQGGVTIQ